MKEFWDFLGDRLNNTDMIVGDFKLHMKDVKDSKNLTFQDLLELFGLIQHVDYPMHKSGHTFDLIIAKEEDTFCISVDKFISLTIVLFFWR